MHAKIKEDEYVFLQRSDNIGQRQMKIRAQAEALEK